MMSATDTPHPTPHPIDASIDEIEAFANGETAYATNATVDLFNRPRVGLEFLTPNGTKMKTTSVDGRFSHKGEEILIIHARVIDAPECPQYMGDTVKVAVFINGTVCVLQEDTPI